ncbi:MAG: phosphotransacetylase family protein [Dehalococcoidia bacterium]|nr:MAG: phosphotransacetylase family protein [Dehalococcoidia bacterium]
MTALQITSYESCGKTALCAGIGKKFINAGKKVGYIKPVNLTGDVAAEGCPDAHFVNQALELGEEKQQVCAFNISQEKLWQSLSEDTNSFAEKIKSACDSVSAGKDILIIETPGILKNDQVSALACYTIAEKVGAKVILLLGYANNVKDADLDQVIAKFGERLIGIVLNQVPETKLDIVKAECEEYFKSRNISVLGVLPESRSLLGVSVAEIAAALGAEIISSKDKSGDLVENVMLGAMTPDSARDYYSRKRNKAVVTRSERPDMQLAALDTSTKCLIVTKQKPSMPVMVKAEDKKVPVLVVNKDIIEAVSAIEQALAQSRFQHMQKLIVLTSILDSRFDFRALNAALGL